VRRFFRRHGRDLTLTEAPKLVQAPDRRGVVEAPAESREVRTGGRPGHGSVPVPLGAEPDGGGT